MTMIYDESFRRAKSDLMTTLEQDLDIIHKDVIAVLQETASVRASMTEFSSWRPGASRRFVVALGVLCFMLVAVLIVYQGQVQAWVQRIGH
jgi:hypothetical protein